ncbi:MAG: hypothetical protein EAZ19_13750 [Oscillatoriales cyanobacterium]|nr:MAG: hypothetical protein EAZ49_26150 [Oscillatoriales cyanobacterium]TAG94512.1 MAG: hypothetical protein EAZ19_13750 [Oscillatoriales cyanobacterium]TAH27854.1 MAG: hypothetical protein EAZ10_07620 [Oscillatoriales cyanobacterium]
MGIGNWELGIGHWELGIGHWALGGFLRFLTCVVDIDEPALGKLLSNSVNTIDSPEMIPQFLVIVLD